MSSLGVQITGGLYLARRHACSIRERIAALAMCRKFHVTRKSAPLVSEMAMCAASSAAWRGIAPVSTSARARASESGDASSSEIALSASSRERAASESPARAAAQQIDNKRTDSGGVTDPQQSRHRLRNAIQTTVGGQPPLSPDGAGSAWHEAMPLTALRPKILTSPAAYRAGFLPSRSGRSPGSAHLSNWLTTRARLPADRRFSRGILPGSTGTSSAR